MQTQRPDQSFRFVLHVGSEQVPVFVSRAILDARFGRGRCPQEVYGAHRELIDAAARRRFQAGARTPVVMRASELFEVEAAPADA